MEQQVEDVIRQYQLTSKSRNLRNLNVKNIKKITKAIDSTKFKELNNKRVQTINHLYVFLDRSINGGELDKTNIDCQFITNRSLAEKYLIEYIISNEEKKSILKGIILQHHSYQEQMKQKRMSLTDPSEISKLDKEIWDTCETFETQAISTFKSLRLPFFNINDSYIYPELNDDKRWFLQKIGDSISI